MNETYTIKTDSKYQKMNCNSILKDSGDRREFSSGAVRDMGGGKGRCDLLPIVECSNFIDSFPKEASNFRLVSISNGSSTRYILEGISYVVNVWNDTIEKKKANILDADCEGIYINQIVNNLYKVLNAFVFYDYICEETNNIFETMTLFDWLKMIDKDNPENKEEAIKRAYSIVPSDAILSLAKHFEQGAVKYGDRNWEKGIPINVFMDSAIRHYLKFKREDNDEPHHRAFMWNIICAIWTIGTFGFEID